MTATAVSNQSDRLERRFLSRAMRAPMLTAAHELALARAWKERRDEAALHELTAAYLKLVIAVASRFRGYGLPFDDLVQEGTIGLMQAAGRFEPEREVRFSTYATWWVRSAIQEYVLRNWSIVRSGTSAAQKALFFNLRWLRSKIEREGIEGETQYAALGRVAAAMKVPLPDVERMAQRLSVRDQSLNATVGEDGGEEIGSFLVDPGPSPEEIVLDRREGGRRRIWLDDALGELSDRERKIVRARFLADDPVTLEELGRELGITKERVRQIEHKAFTKLRTSVLKRSEIVTNFQAAAPTTIVRSPPAA